MNGYRYCLTRPYAARLIAANLVGGLPNGMGVLAIVLYTRDLGWDFLDVGICTALYAVGVALGAPVLNRAMNGLGQTSVLLTGGLASGSAFLVITILPGSARYAILAVIVLAGFFTPPLGFCLRSLWPDLLEDKQALPASYALDASLQQLVFIGGPLLVVALTTGTNGSLALLVVGGVTVVGTLGFALADPVRGRSRSHTPSTGWMGPLESPPIRRLMIGFLCVGGVLGVFNVVMVFTSETLGVPELPGWLLGAHGAGALVGGLAYAGIRWSGSPARRLILLTALLAASYVTLSFIQGLVGLTITMVVAGMMLTPFLACGFLVVGAIAPRGTTTETFVWVVTMLTCGSGLGSFLAGVTVEENQDLGPWMLTALFGIAALTLVISRPLEAHASQRVEMSPRYANTEVPKDLVRQEEPLRPGPSASILSVPVHTFHSIGEAREGVVRLPHIQDGDVVWVPSVKTAGVVVGGTPVIVGSGAVGFRDTPPGFDWYTYGRGAYSSAAELALGLSKGNLPARPRRSAYTL